MPSNCNLMDHQLACRKFVRRRRLTRCLHTVVGLGCLCLSMRAARAFIGIRPNLHSHGPQGAVPAKSPSRFAAAEGEQAPAVVEDVEASKPKNGNWFEETKDFWLDGVELFLSVEHDPAEEARAVVNQTELVERMIENQDAAISKKSYLKGQADAGLGEELGKLQGFVIAYWVMRLGRVFNKESVKKGLISSLTYGNFIFIAIFLRTVVPRLLLVTNMDDFLLVANEIGIPSKSNLVAALESLNSYEFLPKFGLYTLAFIAEKVTLISEVLPVQIGLKTIAPVIFGGLIPGALLSATAETVGAAVNFFIGRSFFTTRIREFSFFWETKPLGEAPWFGRLERAAEKDGFQLTLLLRLSHILPIPFDAYWYILGALPVGPLQFVGAHWLGCLKTAFLDACLGVLLLTSAGISLGGEEKSQIIAAESIAFAIVAFLVQSFATNLAKDILGLEDTLKEGPENGDVPDKPKQPGDGAASV
eukprot:CAMPEP_0203898082 /NCGR_PEP_ID=MMETSP0359-20131031/40653_1 /ASSEMBLY_ACC=CAM_ASM_000338 /TAXON_ID=268821 /ORGANISM="Scrippsiella Hangoei, Strain SHTV-5" /LENGTH=474 /DNA_ID=CAMNT_0050821095 /DNA_START=42 /DNA_END=1466 /DNA_ORIENTATION=+